jgi:hypothetical protein
MSVSPETKVTELSRTTSINPLDRGRYFAKYVKTDGNVRIDIRVASPRFATSRPFSLIFHVGDETW